MGLEVLRDNPKYVNGKEPATQLKVEARCYNLPASRLIGTMLDLE
jgi:hypothetical protein